MAKRRMDLQLFGDGAGAAAAPAAGPASGVNGQGDAAPAQGEQQPVLRTRRGTPIYAPKSEAAEKQEARDADAPKEEETTPEESFDDLIKGKYKADFDAKVQGIIKARLKSAGAAEERLGELAPLMDELGKITGIDTSDIRKVDLDALTKAIVMDKSRIRMEAEDSNRPEEEVRKQKELDYLLGRARRQNEENTREQTLRQRVGEWSRQAQEVVKTYPAFDLAAELDNPDFRRLVENNVPVKTAYEVTHKDEIIGGAMQYTARKVAEKVSKSVQSGMSRPTENGLSSPAASITTDDIKSKAYREEIKNKVRRGERVVL